MKYYFSILIIMFVSFISSGQTDEFIAFSLKCEHLENPIAVDVKNPRFTWKLTDKKRGALQSAYQILIGTDSAAVAEGTGEIWNSGKIISNSNLIRYAGNQLSPFIAGCRR